MIKLMAIGLWALGVMFASAWFAAGYRQQANAAHGEEPAGIEFIKTDMTSVPAIRDGKIEGYVIFQLMVAVNEEKKKKLGIDPLPYVADAAFQTLYGESRLDFSNLQRFKLNELGAAIGKEINRRVGDELVRDVLIQNLNYVGRNDVRTHWIAKE